MKRFSIFLPVRNGWPYVQECVESVLRQTYPHFELHVLDNQSSDNTLPWLGSLTDSRIRFYTSSSALSIVESWARIKSVEKQEFMTLIGDDDLLDPGFLEAIKILIDRHPEASLYQTGARLINSAGEKIRSCLPIADRETAAQYLQARFTFQRDNFGTGFVMRSADYDRVGGIPHFEKLFFADDALWLSLIFQSYKASDPAEHFAVRIHTGSESASLPAAWSSILLSLNQFSDFIKHYIEKDDDARAVTAALEPAFLLKYHRNAYIFALIEACEARQKVSSAVLEKITSSLATCAPSVAGKLRHSAKVTIVEALNASPFRSQVPHLWNAYYRLKTRTL